jgi:ABC-type phosphate/phosphonate transport system substrate-binding protein
VLLGAVAYDPKVVTIWEGFRAWLRGPGGLDFDYVLYSHYERQVLDLVEGRVDVAWNSPLAWVRARRLAAARGVTLTPVTMRDTDCDLRSVIVVRADSAVGSLGDLAGRIVATGAVDSPQATLLPLSLLRSAGLTPRAEDPSAEDPSAEDTSAAHPGADVTVRRFDVGVGLHGDHIGGERDAARALFAADPADRVDAACMIDANLLLFGREGVLPAGAVRVLAQTPPYDHCTMTAGPSVAGSAELARFGELLLGMDYADAELRPLLDLEGLKEWQPPRLSGYDQLERAVDEAGFYDAAGAVTAADYRP